MPRTDPVVIHKKPAQRGQDMPTILMGTTVSTAVNLTAHTVPTPDFILTTTVQYVGIRSVS